VLDTAGSTNKKCKVFLNDNPLVVREFKDYVNLYFDSEDTPRNQARGFLLFADCLLFVFPSKLFFWGMIAVLCASS
jgi:hypothetical protein